MNYTLTTTSISHNFRGFWYSKIKWNTCLEYKISIPYHTTLDQQKDYFLLRISLLLQQNLKNIFKFWDVYTSAFLLRVWQEDLYHSYVHPLSIKL